jgi:dTDP-4-amino-4,6-dideoxygalactose transaminase
MIVKERIPMTTSTGTLACNGGAQAITRDPGDIFTWPIVTQEDEEAVLAVLRRPGGASANDITKEFEREWAAWQGSTYALAYPNGTEALRAAMWAVGVGAGDEVICPSMTYWASCTSALTLGAAVNFADIDPVTLDIDPADIEHRIGPRTKAIMVVHYAGYPAPMDEIMAIARKHGVPVIEDVSHAHGALYKGQKVGTFGDIAAMSMMSGKSFAIGEAGMMVTNNPTYYERCISYGFYERTGVASRFNAPDMQITMDELKPYAGVPMGGYKHRLNQMCSAMGRVQLKYYDARVAEIHAGMNRFWDLLDGVPGIRAHRPVAGSGSTMGGWYSPRGLYRAEELGGLPAAKFCEAVRAEGGASYWCYPGANGPLHLHPVFHTADIFRQGQPTMIAFGQRDVRQGPGTLPVTERIGEIAFGIPWFKHDQPEIIEEYARAYRKVAEHADEVK